MSNVYLRLRGENKRGLTPKAAIEPGWNDPAYRGVGPTDFGRTDIWLGLRLDDYIVVDCDSDEALEAWAGHTCADDRRTWTRKTPHGWHVIYKRVPGQPLVSGAQLKGIHPKIDLKSGPGHQIVFRAPGYFDVVSTDPIPFDYSWLPAVTEHDKGIDEWDDLPNVGANNFLTSVGGKLREWGASERVIFECLLDVNNRTMTDPLSAEKVRRIARSVMRYEPGDPQSYTCPQCGHGFEVL